MIFDTEFWTQVWSDLAAGMATWLPRVAGALLILIAGWLIARSLQAVLGGLLRRVGLDRLAERSGIAGMLKEASLDSSLAYLLARVVYWIVLLIFIIAAMDSLGLPGVGDTLGRLVGYLPNLVGAALILLLGSTVARIAGDFVTTFSSRAEVPSGDILGQVVRYVIVAFSAILALEQLGIETTLLISTAIAIISGTTLALAIGFGIGSRELARNILSGYHVRDAFKTGQHIQIRGHSGELVEIGTVKSRLKTEEGVITLPNVALLEEEVTVMAGKDRENEPV